MIYVYVLKCGDDSKYVGQTNCLESELVKHYNGDMDDTRGKSPFKLGSYTAFPENETARAFLRFLRTRAGHIIMKRFY